MSARRRIHGFTLLETLVALSVLSLVVVALFAAVRTGLRVTEAAETEAEGNQQMRLVSELLSRSLTGLVPLTTVQRGKRIPHLNGEVRKLTVVVESPARFRAGGLYEVTFEQVRHEKAPAVKMSRRLVHPDLLRAGTTSVKYRTAEPDDERILVANATLELDYFGRDSRRADPRWHAEWQGKWGVPLLVRAAIKEPDRNWPEIIARVQVQRARFQNLRGSPGALDEDENDGAAADQDPAAPQGTDPPDESTACVGAECPTALEALIPRS